ncbi:hypothetical protein Tco_1120667 [Tanacetum coccineum]
MSTAEAEYVSLSVCCAQVILMRTQLLEYGYKYNRISMYYDSKSAITISCNLVQHSRTKHIEIRYHCIKEHVEKVTMQLYFVGTEYQLADLFTKALPKERFEYLVHRIEFIMAQPQRQADVHQDELCPPNKRYAFMDANKKIDLDNPLFNIAASSSVLWIYLGQFWHTLKEDGSKYRLSFMLDRKELTLTLDDFRTIFQLPQATNNNHECFVVAPKFSEISCRCCAALSTIYMLTMLTCFGKDCTTYCFVNNIYVNYAEFLWEGLHYSLEHPSTLIPYLRFTKLIVSHYMTAFPEISHRVHDKYHNLEDDEMVKSIFNLGKNKAGVGIKILSWMITDEMKLTDHYRMYVVVFEVDVPTNQSQPIEFT